MRSGTSSFPIQGSCWIGTQHPQKALSCQEGHTPSDSMQGKGRGSGCSLLEPLTLTSQPLKFSIAS